MTATIMITGATDGIGLALAGIYRTHAARLLTIGRRAARDLDPALVASDYCRVDLAQPYARAATGRRPTRARPSSPSSYTGAGSPGSTC